MSLIWIRLCQWLSWITMVAVGLDIKQQRICGRGDLVVVIVNYGICRFKAVLIFWRLQLFEGVFIRTLLKNIKVKKKLKHIVLKYKFYIWAYKIFLAQTEHSVQLLMTKYFVCWWVCPNFIRKTSLRPAQLRRMNVIYKIYYYLCIFIYLLCI